MNTPRPPHLMDPDSTSAGSPPSDLPQTVKVVVDGNPKDVPLTDVINSYQLKTASDARFREAAALRAAAERELQIVEDLKAGFEKSDGTTLMRAFRNLGVPEATIQAMFDAPAAPPADDADNAYADSDPDPAPNNQLLAQLAALQKQVAELQGAHTKAKSIAIARTERGAVAEILDKHPKLSATIQKLRAEKPQTYEWVLSQATSAAKKASETLPWGPRAIHAGIDSLAATLQELGLNQPGATQADDEPTIPNYVPGLGMSPLSTGTLHQTAAEDIKKVSMNDATWQSNFKQRLTARLQKAARALRSQ